MKFFKKGLMLVLVAVTLTTVGCSHMMGSDDGSSVCKAGGKGCAADSK